MHQELLERIVSTEVLHEFDQIEITLHNRIVQQILQQRIIFLICKNYKLLTSPIYLINIYLLTLFIGINSMERFQFILVIGSPCRIIIPIRIVIIIIGLVQVRLLHFPKMCHFGD